MTPELWAKVESLYHAALEVEAGLRDEFLAAQAGDDLSLLHEVQELLDQQDQGGLEDWLERPAWEWNPEEQPEPLQEGMQIGAYLLQEQIGRGGMGTVYRAMDQQSGATVALKFLDPQFGRMEELTRRFQREAQAAASIDDPHVCKVHGLEVVHGHIFLQMEYLEGETVAARVRERPPHLTEALDWAIASALGLRAAHRLGVVHRDIKPANLFLTAAGLKIMDFGIALLVDRSRITRAGRTVGTLKYMSPEQCSGAAQDRRSDIWSLAAVLYEWTAGRHPFPGSDAEQVMQAILSAPPEELPPSCPSFLRRIIGKCLSKDPAKRYQRIDDLAVDLRAVRKQLG